MAADKTRSEKMSTFIAFQNFASVEEARSFLAVDALPEREDNALGVLPDGTLVFARFETELDAEGDEDCPPTYETWVTADLPDEAPFHVNEFDRVGGEITAAYTAEAVPEGKVIGRSGNAALIVTATGVAVVSRPRAEGDIGVDGPLVDLSWAFMSPADE